MLKFIAYNKPDQELPDQCYIIAKNGNYIRKANEVVSSTVKIDKIRSLQDLQENATYLLPALSEKFLMKVWKFFKVVYDQLRTESVLFIYFNRETQLYEAYVPKQKVSGTHTTNIDVINGIERAVPQRENCVLAGTIHSHANMGAFHSGTDDADEEFFDGFHATFGKLKHEKAFDLSVSLVVNGRRFMLGNLEHFEGVIQYNPHRPEPDPIPEEVETSDETASDETTSDETASDETASDETASDETASDETASDETTSKLKYGGNPNSRLDRTANNVISFFAGLFGKKIEKNEVRISKEQKIDLRDVPNSYYQPEFIEPEVVPVEKEGKKKAYISPYNKPSYLSRLAFWREEKKLFSFENEEEDLLNEQDYIELDEWLRKVSNGYKTAYFFPDTKKESENQQEEIIQKGDNSNDKENKSNNEPSKSNIDEEN